MDADQPAVAHLVQSRNAPRRSRSPAHLRPRIGTSNWHSASLDEWQTDLWRLYGQADRRMPMYDMMLQIMGDAARLGEAMRKNQYSEALPLLPHIFSWLCNMVSKCHDQTETYSGLNSSHHLLSRIVWHKYPGVCSTCAKRPCICPALHVDKMSVTERAAFRREKQTELDERRGRSDEMPARLDDWVAMLDAVYGPVNAARDSAQKTFHFLEEVGEVEVELRKADKRRSGIDAADAEWEAEIADVFAWLCAVYLHIKGSLELSDKFLDRFERSQREPDVRRATRRRRPLHVPSLSEWMWREFSDGSSLACFGCRQYPCNEEFALRS